MRESSGQPAFSALVDQLEASEDNRIAIDNTSEDPDSIVDEALKSSESATVLQPVTDSESDLRQVIDDFAEEHQQQLDAESNRLTNPRYCA